MRKIYTFLKISAASVFLGATATVCLADTIILKSGEKLEGKVVEETPAQYTIEYHVSASITDTKVVPKGDVVKIDKELPDEQPYQAVKNVKPGPNSLPTGSYDAVIGKLNGFLNQFPQSSHVDEIKKNLADYEAEKKRVDGGEIKVAQKWYSQEQAQKERVQINGQAMLAYMQDQAARGDLVGAMNSFDQLTKTAPGARSYPDAVDLATRVIVSLKRTADQDLQGLPFQKSEREKGLQLANPNEKAEMVAALDRQAKQEEAEIAASTKAGLAWPPLLKDNEKVLTDLSTKAGEAQKTLAEIPVAKMRQSVALTDAARKQIEKQDYAAADTSLKQATSLWSANELATRLSADVEANKGKVAEAPAPETTPQPAASGAPSASGASGPSSSQPQGSTATSSSDSGDHPNFFLTLPGIVITLLGLIVVFAGVTVYKKVVKRANEILE